MTETEQLTSVNASPAVGCEYRGIDFPEEIFLLDPQAEGPRKLT